MAKQNKGIYIGVDLGPEYVQMTYFCHKMAEPDTVAMIQTPKDLFALVEQKAELGIALLSNFLKESFETLRNIGEIRDMAVMITMERLSSTWVKAVFLALEMLEIPRSRVWLQDYQESFYYYMLSQKQEYWRNQAALFVYEKDGIAAYTFAMNYKTRPALGTVKKQTKLYLDSKTRTEFAGADWDQTRDTLFLSQVKGITDGEVFSSAYLVGDGFDKSWMDRSLAHLCGQCHVFKGNNLYTKGACLAIADRIENPNRSDFLYNGPEMTCHNIGMQMRGDSEVKYHNLITAGVHYCMANYTCEFLLEDTSEVVLESKSIRGESAVHTISLNDLPVRPDKGTRIRMELEFIQKDRCRVKLDDLGMGELCPSSGKKWDAVLEL